ncbi:MAG: LysM peptidoglycan-binding domain-containing protein [Clostridia bacterium]|nr:LysM peptidoglycan-binding domain-containing protein [Clostridia bacterium]
MLIHTVNQGETLYNIARRYSVPATKLLADNDLDGDRLTEGEQLLVLTPTRTVTVRGGESAASIAKRFSVREQTLFTNNPQLALQGRLLPGQILTVKQAMPSVGVGSALGIYRKGCRREHLARALPYITYLSVNAGRLTTGGITLAFAPEYAHREAVLAGKVPLLGIEDETDGAFLASKEGYTSVISRAITLSSELGMKGVYISAKVASEKYPDAFCEFLMSARKQFIGCDLILFTEVFGNTPHDAAEISDGAVLIASDSGIDETARELSDFCTDAESGKVFVSLTGTASFFGERIDIKEAKELCYRSGGRICTDEKSLISEFEYKRYKIGLGEVTSVSFPSLSYTKAKLERIAELGFIGICVDIKSLCLSQLCMFNAMFKRADYSMPHDI